MRLTIGQSLLVPPRQMSVWGKVVRVTVNVGVRLQVISCTVDLDAVDFAIKFPAAVLSTNHAPPDTTRVRLPFAP